LHQVTLAQLLEAICAAASQPVHYQLVDFGVIFVGGKRPPTVITRLYKLEPEAFRQAIQNQFGDDLKAAPPATQRLDPSRQTEADGYARAKSEANRLDSAQRMVRRAFAKLGVDFERADYAGKSIFYNESNGQLFVRATEEDQQAVEVALQALGTGPRAKMAGSGVGNTSSRGTIRPLTPTQNGRE
ncbi:MAG TPA: hypothetical protein VHH73_10675, partial [Verrucomicrobiae bacterium]|nr:hypothetical protein [Verrucomicrobiae bacterium]